MDVFKTLLLDTPDSLNAITGTLQIANGGTGATSAAGARDNLLPDYTGNVGKVLTVNAGATDVEWTTNGSGTVTSVDVSGGTTGLTTSGGPVTSSGTITLAGTLAVANGGTGITSLGSGVATFLGTPSSANLAAAVTDETGTGALVFANSPTLVGPALGTPASGVVTNLTGTASININGTVGATTPTTGVFTALTVNDNSTLGSSNTDTVNFNARVASDINPSADDTYDLGVTGHEWRNLNIDGTANIDSLVADTADINGGTIDATTVGATTPSTGAFTTLGASATGQVLSLTTSQNVRSGSGSVFGRLIDSVGNAGVLGFAGLNNSLDIATNFAGGFVRILAESSAEVARFSTTGLAVTGALSSTTGANFATSSGNVGIGTATPGGKLNVVGTASIGNGAVTPLRALHLTRIGADETLSGIAFSDGTNGDYRSFIKPNFSGGTAASNKLVFSVSDGTTTGTADVFTATGAGNVGIGTTSPGAKLDVKATDANTSSVTELLRLDHIPSGGVGGGAGIGSSISFRTVNATPFAYEGARIQHIQTAVSAGAEDNALTFSNYSAGLGGFAERMRILGGKVLIGTTTAPTIAGVPSGSSVVRAGAGDWTWTAQSTSASSNRGMVVHYSAAAPNDTANEMIFCYDTGGTRFAVRSNGGIANYQANDVNLSDERVKTDIIPAGSYLDKVCAINVVKYKYKDQTHDDYNLGVIAQQVEAVAPEFVDADGFNPLRNDEIPLKAIYQTDLSYGILKAVQELAEENKALRKRIEALESR